MEKDIGKIKKNDTTDIVVRIDDFGGRTGLTIREFVSGDRYTGFTKAGTRIPSAGFLKFREMIDSISLDDMKEPEGAGADTESSTSTGTAKKPFKKSSPQEELPDY